MKHPAIRRAPIREALWAGGRPTVASDESRQFAEVAVAAMRAGLTEAQALALTELAYDAAHLYDWTLPSGKLRQATRGRCVEEQPNGKWAHVRREHGSAFLFMDDDDPRSRHWHPSDPEHLVPTAAA